MDSITSMAPDKTLSQLAGGANAAHLHVERLAGQALSYANEAGQLLAVAKMSVPHGQFEQWLAENVTFSTRTARAYMRIAKNWPALADKRSECPNLSLRETMELLSTSQCEDSQNGSTLPFCPLPRSGELLLALIGSNGDALILESCPFDDCYVRMASLIGDELTFDTRGVIRSAIEAQFTAQGIDPSECSWMPPMPATAVNNPFSSLITGWQYGTAVPA
jgi:hypothetical protein